MDGIYELRGTPNHAKRAKLMLRWRRDRQKVSNCYHKIKKESEMKKTVIASLMSLHFLDHCTQSQWREC